MPFEQLIDQLTSDLRPVHRRSQAFDAIALAVLGALELLLFLGAGAMRGDMHFAMQQPSFWWKLAVVTLCLAIRVAIDVSQGGAATLAKRPLHWPERPGVSV